MEKASASYQAKVAVATLFQTREHYETPRRMPLLHVAELIGWGRNPSIDAGRDFDNPKEHN